MKKLSLLFSLMMVSVLLMAQPFEVINWVNLDDEPDYAAAPYNKETQVAIKAPGDWTPVSDAASFDATWSILGDSASISNLTSNGVAGDLFDLGEASPSFGAAWKAVYDADNLYVLLKYWDLSTQADDGSLAFEIMAQTHPATDMETGRYTPDFVAAGDDVALQKASYGRFIELAGGKTVVSASGVAEYNTSTGLDGGTWGTYGPGIQGLSTSAQFWDDDGAGVIRAVLVMPFATTLAYPTDPLGDLTVLTAFDPSLTPGADTIVFDVKSNSTVGGTDDDNKVEYFWSANANNGYAMNYYSGLLVFEEAGSAGGDPMEVINWVNLDDEPDYAADPYEKEDYVAIMAPGDWTPVSDAASFDATWSILGDSASISNLTSNGVAGDLFDLGEASPSFGAAWKAVYDADNLYVLLKYWDLSTQADDASLAFEIMAQTHPLTDMETGRYTPDFVAAGDDVALQKASYGRFIELAGGKTVVSASGVAEYNASTGQDGGTWGTYGAGIQGLSTSTQFWDDDGAGIIRAVLVMPFASTLAYPADPYSDLTAVTAFDPSATTGADTIVFDVKSNSTVGGSEDDNKVEYFWSADANNGYAINYYSGRLIFDAPTGILDYINGKGYAKVYMHNDILRIRGEQPADVEVYSITGSRVKVATQTNQVDMSNLNNGVYIVRLNGAQKAYKVVK